MSIGPALTPDPDKAPPPTVPIRDALEHDNTASSPLPTPVALFDRVRNHNTVSIADSTRSAAKRPASPRAASTMAAMSPLTKRANSSASPVRAAIVRVVSVAASIANAVVPDTVPFPPQINRSISPRSTIPSVLVDNSAPPREKAKGTGSVMYGFVPKTELLPWMRNSQQSKAKLSDVSMKKEMRQIRQSILYHFSRSSNLQVPGGTNASCGPTTRSSVDDDDDWMVDLDAASCEVTDTRRLNRYPLEQLFTLQARSRLLLLVDANQKDSPFLTKMEKHHDAQNLPLTVIGGREYYQLRVRMHDVTNNEMVVLGNSPIYNVSQFKDDVLSGHKGFDVVFDGTGGKHNFTWKQVLLNPTEFMFFGPPLTMSRSYDRIFKDINNFTTLHHRFVNYYRHFIGDVTACLSLYNSYLTRRMAIMEKLSKRESISRYNIRGDLFTTKECTDFCQRFDKMCAERIESVLVNFHNHSQPILDTNKVKGFISEAPKIFGGLWNILCDLRGVKANHAKEKTRTLTKFNEVFFQLLAMIRIANRRKLKYWAMIGNISNFARGVGRHAESAFSYFGHTLSPSARHQLFNKLTGNSKQSGSDNNSLREKQSRLFRTCAALIFTYDNYQRGMTLQEQRGKHSSAFFKGTHQCAHKVFPFQDCTFDECFVYFSQHDQDIPSPWGMPAFECIDQIDPSGCFVDFDSWESVKTPDFTGERVRSYIDLRNMASQLVQLSTAFPTEKEDTDYFAQCPTSFDKKKLKDFTRRCNNREAQHLVTKAKEFQRNTVRRWNPHADECSLSIYLGLIGIDESASKECGVITLDLLLRAGVLIQSDDGSWELADDWDKRRIYIFGDAKTIENMAKFVRDMQDRRISYSVANLQGEMFLKAVSTIMDLPGDWHAGLAMAQSIYNIYFVGFLDQFMDLLGWNKIYFEVSKCYYQATRLITFVHDELHRFLTHQFIAERIASPDEKDLTDAKFIMKVSIELSEFFENLKESDDDWIKTCANFLEMSHDFLEFVKAYRSGDSVSVEHGYLKHNPVFKSTGQNKYVQIVFGQQETLYRDHPFSRLQEIRMNRVVRRYAKKNCVAHDEFLEHGNRFFSEFSTPKSVVAFCNQSLYVGVGLMSKQMTNKWYTTKMRSDDNIPDYQSTVKPSMTPEKQMLYQVFVLLKTHVVNPRRKKFDMKYVSSIEDEITVVLKRTVLERSMKEAPTTSADDLLKCLSDLYQQSIDSIGGVNQEEELDAGETDHLEREPADVCRVPESRTGRKKVGEKIAKRQMNKQISDDHWVLGKKEFEKSDVVSERANALSKREKKTTLRRCIMKTIHEKKTKSVVSIPDDVDYMSSLQRHVRKTNNNLHLKMK